MSPPGVRCASVPDGHGPGWCAGRRRCPASSRGPLRNVIDALERSRLRVPQNQLPDGIGDVACLGGLAKSKPGHLLVHDGDVPQRGRGLHPAVVLQPLLHPAVVEALRGFVQHQLQDGLAGPDLEEADVRAIGTCPAPRGGGVKAHQLDHVVGVAELAVDGGGH